MRNVKVAVELKVVIPVCFFERAGNKAFNSVAMIDANCRNQLPPEITVIEMSTNDAWARDCGPSFFVNDHGDLRACDWTFNAWGVLPANSVSHLI